jgi:uncharacterized protein (TIGR02466 family)
MIQIITIFPTPIYKVNLNRLLDENETFTIEKYEKEVENNSFNKITADHNVLDNSNSLHKLKNFFNEGINVYVKTVYDPKKNIDVYITESWINYTYKNQFHHQHYHPNSFISGVFYVNCVENDSIIFKKDNPSMIEIESNNYNYFNSNSWSLPVIKGDLILFPSNLQHQVSKNLTNTTRISLSFNTYLKGNISNQPSLTLSI